MKQIFYAAIFLALSCPAYTAMAKTPEIYLDKLDKTLDDWWNALDNVCRVFLEVAKKVIWLVISDWQ